MYENVPYLEVCFHHFIFALNTQKVKYINSFSFSSTLPHFFFSCYIIMFQEYQTGNSGKWTLERH